MSVERALDHYLNRIDLVGSLLQDSSRQDGLTELQNTIHIVESQVVNINVILRSESGGG